MTGYHDTITNFKRAFLTHTLMAYGGNRSRTARALGLQRTYLLRLIREHRIEVPRPTTTRRNGGS